MTDPVKALDLSKYTATVTDDVVNRWCAEGIGLLIIQMHPAGYGQERSLDLARTARRHRCDRHADGMPWDSYIYEYLAYPDWTEGACATMDLLAAEGNTNREGWLDTEDVDTGKGWSAEQRVQAIVRDFNVYDAWLAAHGCPRAGDYSGRWYVVGYLGNTSAFADRELWDGHYDRIADAAANFVPYGGWDRATIKQYAGTSVDIVGGVDLDVLSDAEAAELTHTEETDDMQHPVPDRYTQNGWNDWFTVAVNLQGIADAMGRQVDALSQEVAASSPATVADLRDRLAKISAIATV